MEASGAHHALVILPPGKEPAVPVALEDGWAPWQSGQFGEEGLLAVPGFESQIVWPVA